MGLNNSKLGYFGLLPPDLRKPGFIQLYLCGSDFKLLLAAFKVNMIECYDVEYYYEHYPTCNLNLHKYYDFTECVRDFRYDTRYRWIRFIHINGAVFDEEVSKYLVCNFDMT